MAKKNLFSSIIAAAVIAISGIGSAGGRVIAQTTVPTQNTPESGILSSPSAVQNKTGEQSVCQSPGSGACKSQVSGVNINPNTTSKANGNQLQNANSATVAPISNDSAAAVTAIQKLSATQGQNLTNDQRNALTSYFNSNPLAAASAATNPQQFLTNNIKNTSAVTGSGNSGASTAGNISNNITNPGLSDLQAFLLGLKPVTVLPANAGQITTGTNATFCPDPVYGTKGGTTTLYIVGWSGTRPILAPGQKVTLDLHDNCLRLRNEQNVNAAKLQDRVAYWNTVPCEVAAPEILSELFGRNLPTEYFLMKTLLNQKGTAACDYGISTLFNNRNPMSSVGKGSGEEKVRLRVSVSSVSDLRKQVIDLEANTKAANRYARAGSVLSASVANTTADSLQKLLVSEGVSPELLDKFIDLNRQLAVKQDSPKEKIQAMLINSTIEMKRAEILNQLGISH